MPKLTDEEIEAIDKALTKTWSMNRMESDRYQAKIRNNTYRWLTELVAEVKEMRAKAPDPTPPVQPDKPEPGDKVRHKDKKHFGIGIVDEIAKSGLRAYCRFPDYDRRRSSWEPQAYYRLDKLEVITDDPST